jgi:hypothetical protein
MDDLEDKRAIKIKSRRNCQGCQMVYFHTQTPNRGKFWRALEYKMLVRICNILCSFCKFFGQFVYFMVIWYIRMWLFGIFFR